MPPKRMGKKARVTAPVRIVNPLEGGSGLNPMDNHVAIERLFDVMPFDFGEFKNLRMVSRIWWEASLPKWRKNTWLCVKDKPENAKIQRSSFEHFVDWLSIPGDPYKLLKDNTNFSKYRLEGLHVNLSRVTQAWQHKTNFWVHLGPKMTILELSKSVIYDKEDLRRLLFQLTPNLKALSLQNNVFKDGPALLEDGSLRLAPTTWDERYRPAPSQIQGNLVELEVNFESVSNEGTDFPLCWIELFVRYPNLEVITLRRRSSTTVMDVGGPRQTMFREILGFQGCFRIVRENCGANYLAQLNEFKLHRWSLPTSCFRDNPEPEEILNDEVMEIVVLQRFHEDRQQRERERQERAQVRQQRAQERQQLARERQQRAQEQLARERQQRAQERQQRAQERQQRAQQRQQRVNGESK